MDALHPLHGLDLPNDVCQYIVAFLSAWDVCSLALCSRQLHTICSSNFVWYGLYKKRWVLENSKIARVRVSSKDDGNHTTCASYSNCSKGWRSEYIYVHKQMATGATSAIEYVKSRACFDSMEVAEYQKAMVLLSSVGLEFQDVEMFLLMPKLSVLINLLGLHYCLVHLKIKGKDAQEALRRKKVGERQVCLRWWSLGGWTNRYRRPDEMHMRISSLVSLTESESCSFLEVIDRGTLHEVLRVQISADFESSAWVARSMHSQR